MVQVLSGQRRAAQPLLLIAVRQRMICSGLHQCESLRLLTTCTVQDC